MIKNNQSGMAQMQDLLAEIASGKKLLDIADDSALFVDSLRLDQQEATIKQVQETMTKSQEFAYNTDTVLSQFSSSLDTFKTKLIQASNDTNSALERTAIAGELRGIKENLIALANTSINGQYLFSGTAVNSKAVDENGNYLGNGDRLYAVGGKDVLQQYNIDGESLFVGNDSYYNKKVTTNIKLTNQITPEDGYITASNTIRELTGDTDAVISVNPLDSAFYVRGMRGDGVAVKAKIPLRSDDLVSSLLTKIGEAYGNTAATQYVDVKMNDFGQIEVMDLTKGNKALDFHIVGAVDDDNGSVNHADAALGGSGDNIDTMFARANTRRVDFIDSNFNHMTGSSDDYDRTLFTKDEATLTSNIRQVVGSNDAYATEDTKLSDVAGTTTLNGKRFNADMVRVSGAANNNSSISLAATSTFTLDGGANTFTIWDENGAVTGADNVSYKQMMDVVALMVNGNAPAADTHADYNAAVDAARANVDVYLDDMGQMVIHDKTNTSSPIEFGMYDSDTQMFTGAAADANALTFMSNNAITIDEPQIDFFAQLDQIIEAVENGSQSPDHNSSNARDLGLQNALELLDHLAEHVNVKHAEIGAYTNAMELTVQRNEVLNINIAQVKNELLDSDLAEVSMKYQQASLSYQAMLSTVGKISQLSLVNYI
jgi:flagellar hook-associated protein 3 FlgL